VPDAEKGTLGNVEFAPAEVIELLCLLQQLDDDRIDLDRRNTGIIVDRLQVVEPVVVVVNVEEIVVVSEEIRRLLIGSAEFILADVVNAQ